MGDERDQPEDSDVGGENAEMYAGTSDDLPEYILTPGYMVSVEPMTCYITLLTRPTSMQTSTLVLMNLALTPVYDDGLSVFMMSENCFAF